MNPSDFSTGSAAHFVFRLIALTSLCFFFGFRASFPRTGPGERSHGHTLSFPFMLTIITPHTSMPL
jgi:hypothetical protein